MNSTIEQRRELWTQLGNKLKRWSKATDAELLAEMKILFPAVVEATRYECVQFLVMEHTHLMIEGRKFSGSPRKAGT